MRKNFKIVIAAITAIVTLALFLFIFRFFARPSSTLSYLPEPPELKQYALAETRGDNFPLRMSAFLTDGPFALLHRGSSSGTLLSLAATARETAILVVNDGIGGARVCAAYRLPAKMSSRLEKGELPDEWKELIPSARVEKSGEKGAWEIWSASLDAPIHYYTDKQNVVLAADKESFAGLLGQRSAKKRRHVWRQEKSWPGHVEFGDGAVLLEGSAPLKIQFAWRGLEQKNDGEPAGEAKWTVSGLGTTKKTALLMAAKPVEWNPSEYVIPTSPVLVAALNIPKLKGSPKSWPFPLSAAANMAELLGLNENSIREVTSGKTIFSLGGKNKLLWLSLPGVLVEFSGKKAVMRQLVESFWDNFFLDSEPKKLEGWEHGGTISSPFSVIGAGHGEKALLGLVSPDSLQNGEWLSRYISKKEKAIGWIFVDMSRLGESLSDMTKMMSLLTFEDGDDEYGTETKETESGPYRPTEIDQGVTDSFRRLLTSLGDVLVIWERPESGRINWYK